MRRKTRLFGLDRWLFVWGWIGLSFSFAWGLQAQESQQLGAAGSSGDSVRVRQVRAAKSDRWFGKDKYMHIAGSAFLVGTQMYIYKQHLQMSESEALTSAVLGAGIAGFGKELYDRISGRGHASLKDLVADFVGIAAGGFIFYLN
ncbi:MAG: hypothetical protein D6814_13600 [Calditrichaeota bacterium]|nr:MAG: hypothetical protein D6814_13600 [Calditrichota bacterium]